LIIYPNPTTDFLSIQLLQPAKKKYQIYNQAGKLILEKKVEGLHINRIDLSGIPSGMYTVKIDAGESVHSRKIIKL